ncbi:hypothetical protein BY458DRAFT_33921 [Sporodiniella umbellata]|nr:hypothetical protein BY458DRAFT_33921 [Sporodiniella umbellata]
MNENNKRTFSASFSDEENEEYLISASLEKEIVTNVKQDFGSSFLEEEEEDYLISASMDFEKEQEIMTFDEYMNHRPPASNEHGESSTSFRNSIIDAVESMEIDDNDPLFVSDLTTSPGILPTATPKKTVEYRKTVEYKKVMSTLVLPPAVEKRAVDYTKVPETGAFVLAVCPKTGKTLYLPKRVEAEGKGRSRDLYKRIIKESNKGNLLPTSIATLMKNIEQENIEKLRKIEEEIDNDKKQKKKKKRGTSKDTSGILWVDRYRPKSYSELTGDQRLFREVLQWIKQWDFCVFNRVPYQETQRDKAMKQFKDTQNPNKFYKRFDPRETNDSLLRPEKRILLLSGPPGFGKTTVAHVMAKMAGYNLIEINASDDRTSDVVNTKIKAALEMQAIIRKPNESEKKTMNMDQKPNLIVIDEIDGVSNRNGTGGTDSFISQLIHIASVESNKGKRSKSKKKESPLRRPIICICNDVYAPALRPLRQIAQVMNFKEVPMITVAKRLYEICNYEGLETDLGSLRVLAETADGDLRSCINTLQYIRSTSTVFTKKMLTEDSLGKKDTSKSLFSIWDNIFCNPKSSTTGDHGRYVDRLVETVTANGEIDKIFQGCYESYPLMRFHDVAMEKCCQMNEWLHFYDQLNHRVNTRQEYALYKYLPYPVVNFHRFFAGTTSQEHRVEYPRADYQLYSSRKTVENLIDMFLAGIKPAKRRFLNREVISTELIPHLMYIISPNLKKVNKTLFAPEEKDTLTKLVNTMIDYGLTYITQKTKEGQVILKLEPPVEQLLYFELSKPKWLLPRQHELRQLIASEIQQEAIIAREELANSKHKKGMVLKPVEVKKTQLLLKKEARDYFNRPIVIEESDTSTMEVDTITQPVVRYIYHEGSSNAVKKPMKVKDFF